MSGRGDQRLDPEELGESRGGDLQVAAATPTDGTGLFEVAKHARYVRAAGAYRLRHLLVRQGMRERHEVEARSRPVLGQLEEEPAEALRHFRTHQGQHPVGHVGEQA